MGRLDGWSTPSASPRRPVWAAACSPRVGGRRRRPGVSTYSLKAWSARSSRLGGRRCRHRRLGGRPGLRCHRGMAALRLDGGGQSGVGVAQPLSGQGTRAQGHPVQPGAAGPVRTMAAKSIPASPASRTPGQHGHRWLGCHDSAVVAKACVTLLSDWLPRPPARCSMSTAGCTPSEPEQRVPPEPDPPPSGRANHQGSRQLRPHVARLPTMRSPSSPGLAHATVWWGEPDGAVAGPGRRHRLHGGIGGGIVGAGMGMRLPQAVVRRPHPWRSPGCSGGWWAADRHRGAACRTTRHRDRHGVAGGQSTAATYRARSSDAVGVLRYHPASTT